MLSTTTFRRGQVVVVNVPFSDHTGVKPRPVLIVSTETFHRYLRDLLVCPISSQPRYYRRPGPGDCPLRHWRPAGLQYPSTVRISKMLAVEKQIIKRTLASVSQEDLARVQSSMRAALGLG